MSPAKRAGAIAALALLVAIRLSGFWSATMSPLLLQAVWSESLVGATVAILIGAPPDGADPEDYYRWAEPVDVSPPMMEAAFRADVQMMRLLLFFGADAETCASDCCTLDAAAMAGSLEAVELLLEAGATTHWEGHQPTGPDAAEIRRVLEKRSR